MSNLVTEALITSRTALTISVETNNNYLRECRICLDSGSTPENPLIAPCRCTGSIKYVHKSCFLKWLKVSHEGRS